MGYDHIRSILGTRVEVWAVKRLARRAALVIQDRFHGPIPARAGQPLRYFSRCWCLWAYPRSRGATITTASRPIWCMGLSPLARGNHGCGVQLADIEGPIPARAGQPVRAEVPSCATRAYPRSRGATDSHSAALLGLKGLSPLARGNRPPLRINPGDRGPIPARAGQPDQPATLANSSRAYPRSRGATVSTVLRGFTAKGLSPLARGNHRSRSGHHAVAGPIPARAGQPLLS